MPTNHGNIILFPTGKTPAQNQAQHVIAGVEKSLDVLEKPPSKITIYRERDTRLYYQTSQFLEILFSHGYVSISMDTASNISYDSIMTVCDKNGSEYQLPVDYFIRLTSEFPEKINNDTQSILDHLSDMNIRVGMNTVNNSIVRTIFTIEEMECYKPEEISGFINKDSLYQCEMYHEFGVPIGWGEVDTFQLSSHHVTLLDLMIISLENTELSGYKIAGANMEIIATNRDETVITTIAADLLEQVIHNSLQRINPFLYGNRSFRSAHQHYFQTVVVPKIKPESEQIKLDE